MKQNALEGMTVDELAQQFLDVTVRQDKAERRGEYAEYTCLYRRMEAVLKQLKSRSGDQRRALLPLYNHQKAQVRLMAAVATLAIAPEEARQVLRIIDSRDEYPQAADARGILKDLEAGRFVLT